MSVSDGLRSNTSPLEQRLPTEVVGDVTLTGDLVLTSQYRPKLRLDPGGAGRNVDLPAENISAGLTFEILNTADAAETLTVRDDSGSTVVAIAQNEKATVVCDGTTWHHMGIVTIALS